MKKFSITVAGMVMAGVITALIVRKMTAEKNEAAE